MNIYYMGENIMLRWLEDARRQEDAMRELARLGQEFDQE